MVPQIHATLVQILPDPIATRLDPGGAAFHVAVAEAPALPVDDPRPRRLQPSALTWLAMRAPTALKDVAAYHARERRLHRTELLGVHLLEV